MPFVTTRDNTVIYYNNWGTGTPVVLIHGWPVHSGMWEKQATFLAENGLRVITYDRRGYGWSSNPWSGYDYDTFAADLNAVMEELDVHGATLVGFSMGGGEVVRYLSRYGSARVSNAVLVSAVTPYLYRASDNPEGVDPKVFDEIEQSIRKDRPAFLKEFGAKFFGRTALKHPVSEAVLEWNQEMALTGSLRSTLAAAKAWSMTDFREEMKRITVPVRVIHGTGDVTVPIDASARRSAKLLPNATLSEYDGEPHGLFMTAADRLNAELLQFVGAPAAPLTDPKLSEYVLAR
jgi:pimeloyl-ACP methyl ester carboxylesterase